MPRAELYALYRELGFTKYEGFCTWCVAQHDFRADPAAAREEAARYGLEITSFHLPQIGEDIEAGLADALTAARFASQLSDNPPVLFKAASREIFARATRPFLDALEGEGIRVVPVVQNHKGTAITTLEDYREVLASANDPRLKGLLEVGHFARVGTPWNAGWELLEGRIGLIHVNEIREGASVLFGTGEVDFAGLLKQIKASGYAGHIVVELELATRDTEIPPTINGLRDALTLLDELWEQA
jgi:sugar phosphate isomerase/epimerase